MTKNKMGPTTKDIHTEEFFVNLGPQHPSTHGVLYLEAKLDGEVIIDCTTHIGYLHRSMEKIAENRTYTQFIPFTDRLDYVASMNNNLAYVMAVEKLMKTEVSERAKYIRVIIAELNRVASHLVGIGTFVQDLGAFATPLFYAFREREKIIEIFDAVCGNRLTYNYIRVGGVQFDLPAGIDLKIREFIGYMRTRTDELEGLFTKNVIFLARTKGIGVLPKDMAINYSVTGPNLRGSGVKWDLRKDEPYLVYDKFNFDIPTGDNGDAWDRYKVRIEEMRQSLRIIEQAIGGIPEGDPTVKVGRILRPEPGEAYFRAENPRGELGFYIVSDGSPYPYRLKIRGPSFSNLAVLTPLVRGVKVADLICILGSLDIVLGEIDR
ncbi:MAG: NADH-quinone oxidoreductase subunit D [Candidatus Omnitrophota bacterium]|nr:NADH-quinone oxidoreductase subunit D [Candidatus Omnitrophota bacterium]